MISTAQIFFQDKSEDGEIKNYETLIGLYQVVPASTEFRSLSCMLHRDLFLQLPLHDFRKSRKNWSAIISSNALK